MEWLKSFTEKLQKFYALVETHESQIESLIKKANLSVSFISNQSRFYRAAAPEDSLLNTPFEQFEGFRENLIEVIWASLQQKYNQLSEIRDEINSANEKLLNELLSIEASYIPLGTKNVLDAAKINPCCPSFEHIVDWCRDIWQYYHSYYLQISCALFNLNFEDEATVMALKKSFKEDEKLKNQINRIRSFNFSKFKFLI